jgi:hypothetical protein
MAKLGEQITKIDPFLKYLKVQKSTDMSWKNYRLMLIGPSNEGKTECAATASEFYKEERSEICQLQDMIWLLLDNDGLSAFKKRNLDVDFIDLTNVPLEEFEVILLKSISYVNDLLKSGEKKTVVIDSLSTVDCLIQARLKAEYEGSKFGYWDAVLAAHMKIFTALKSLEGNLIAVVHVIPVNVFGEGDAKKAAEAKLQAQGLKEGDLKFDIAGKSYNFYKNNFSEIWPIRAYGQAPKRTFTLHPYGIAGIEAKTKQNCFNKEEPANLQKLFEKIRNSGK